MATDPIQQLVNLEAKASPIKDQGNEGACTAFATMGVAEYQELEELRLKLPAAQAPEVFSPTQFSPLSEHYHYFNERFIDGDVTDDAGSSLSTSMLALAKYGCVPESSWPYDPSFMYRTPSPAVYALGAQHKVTTTMQLDSLQDMLHCLSQGFPFVGGLSLFDSFISEETASSGIVPYPHLNSESFQGGHALSFFGYDLSKKLFLGRNSWGTGWGQKGWFWVPFNYLANPQLADDFHTIRR